MALSTSSEEPLSPLLLSELLLSRFLLISFVAFLAASFFDLLLAWSMLCFLEGASEDEALALAFDF